MLSEARWIHRAAAVFQRAQVPLYIVGGAVRNPLMGLPISDVDVCGPARPETILALCEGTEIRARLRAAHFGTVELHLTDEDGVRHMAEYTTFREDSYRCGHKPDSVRFTENIDVDALRRDFSVNALYRQVHPNGLGPVIDPTGGLAHLRESVLHTVTADPDQVLKDDGLRILRAARFQAELDLQPTPALLDSLTRYAPLLREIAPERLREELQKTLLADWRYPQLVRRKPGSESGLNTLCRVGAWPWLMENLPCREENRRAMGTLQPVEGLSPVSLRLALLLAGTPGKDAAAVMDRLRFSRREVDETVRLLDAYSQALAGTTGPVWAARTGLVRLRGVSALLRALCHFETAGVLDALACRMLERRLPLTLRELAVHGGDLAPLIREKNAPASVTGLLLEALWDAVLREEAPNQKEALLKMAAGLPLFHS